MVTFLSMLFILTPIAALQTCAGLVALASLFGMGIIEADFLSFIIATVILIILNKISSLLRYGRTGRHHFLLFLFDIPLSCLRLPFQLISDVLYILPFTNSYIDPGCEPSLEEHGLKNYFIIHYLQFVPESNPYRARPKNNNEPSSDAAEYKWQNVRYQFVLWILTALHSIFFVGGAFFYAVTYFSGTGNPADGFLLLGVVIVLVIVYFVLSVITAQKKGVTVSDRYYENTQITRVTVEKKIFFDEYETKRKVIQEAGWKDYLTAPMIIYLLFAWIMIIPQTITLIIALITPPYSAILPVRTVDIDPDSLSVGDRITLFLFGFIKN